MDLGVQFSSSSSKKHRRSQTQTDLFISYGFRRANFLLGRNKKIELFFKINKKLGRHLVHVFLRSVVGCKISWQYAIYFIVKNLILIDIFMQTYHKFFEHINYSVRTYKYQFLDMQICFFL